jgi:hypothetical protein
VPRWIRRRRWNWNHRSASSDTVLLLAVRVILSFGDTLEPKGTLIRKTTTNIPTQDEVTILVRVLCNEEGKLPPEIARYFLTLGFSERDKARMHDLAVRNQEGALSPAETEELFAYGKAGGLLSLLKSKARRALGVKAKKHTIS